MLAKKKAFIEDHLMGLDVEVERISQRVDGLEAEKEAFKRRVKLQGE